MIFDGGTDINNGNDWIEFNQTLPTTTTAATAAPVIQQTTDMMNGITTKSVIMIKGCLTSYVSVKVVVIGGLINHVKYLICRLQDTMNQPLSCRGFPTDGSQAPG
eukprot:scaffold50676_cov32-Prasinocladus_malaysianus.AAC.1